MIPDHDEIRTSKMPIYTSAIVVQETKTLRARSTSARASSSLRLLPQRAAAQNKSETIYFVGDNLLSRIMSSREFANIFTIDYSTRSDTKNLLVFNLLRKLSRNDIINITFKFSGDSNIFFKKTRLKIKRLCSFLIDKLWNVDPKLFCFFIIYFNMKYL